MSTHRLRIWVGRPWPSCGCARREARIGLVEAGLIDDSAAFVIDGIHRAIRPASPEMAHAVANYFCRRRIHLSPLDRLDEPRASPDAECGQAHATTSIIRSVSAKRMRVAGGGAVHIA